MMSAKNHKIYTFFLKYNVADYTFCSQDLALKFLKNFYQTKFNFPLSTNS